VRPAGLNFPTSVPIDETVGENLPVFVAVSHE
jgi:hypothetical protein